MNAFRKWFLQIIILLITLSIVLPIEAAIVSSSSREARLLWATGMSIKTREEVVFFFKTHKLDIIYKLNEKHPLIRIYVAQKLSDRPVYRRNELDSPINKIEFLFEHISCKDLGVVDNWENIVFPKKGLLFQVLVPVILKGSQYKERDGWIILAEPSSFQEESIKKYSEGYTTRTATVSIVTSGSTVYAALRGFVVDEEGNIYDEFLSPENPPSVNRAGYRTPVYYPAGNEQLQIIK